MKKILLIIALALPVITAAQTPIFSINNGIISTKSEFIEQPYTHPVVEAKKYTLNNPITVPAGNSSYIIKTARFTSSAEDDPGDFDIIQISQNGVQRLLFKDPDSFVRLNTKEDPYVNKFMQYSDNSYFIPITLSANVKALLFIGMSYGSDLPTLTLFVVTPQDVKRVFYKKLKIESLIKTTSVFSLTGYFKSDEVLSATETILSPRYSIYLQDGVLWFK